MRNNRESNKRTNTPSRKFTGRSNDKGRPKPKGRMEQPDKGKRIQTKPDSAEESRKVYSKTEKPARTIEGKFQKTEKKYSKTNSGRETNTKRGFKPDEKIRLNRYLSNSGVCSRREADIYISTGCVTVNGKTATELGTKVALNDEVRFNGELLMPERKVYLLLNKPKGYLTTTDDPHENKTVMDLVKNACTERIYPVGRLDRDTTGLLLFTNDGDLAKKLMHPSHSRKKIYQANLDKPLTKNDLLQIAKGVELEDGFIAADAINYINEEDKREIGIEIHSGQNRIVRRIFSHLGYEVEKLDRVFYAGLTKKNLPRGKWRFLSLAEINQLKMLK